MDNLIQTMLNPIRMQIVQHLVSHETVTAGELVSLLPNIPRTTLYRHLNKLAKANVLTVVSENRVRGTVEKVYSLNNSAISSENTIENATRNAFNVLMTIYADFERYFTDPNSDPEGDRIFINKVVMQMSDDEYDLFLSEIGKTIVRYMRLEPTAKRRPRNVSIVSAPNIE